MFLNPNKEIERHRGNLPHWQQGQAWLFVTWRLADSLPKHIVEQLLHKRTIWESNHPKPWDDATMKEHSRLFTLRLETLLDHSHGSCILGSPGSRQIVSNALLHFHGDRYELDSFVVMPNHVHVLFQPLDGHKMEKIIQSWKRFTAREINKAINKTGTIWQREYWDRLIRSEKQWVWTRNYIAKNSAKLPANTYTLHQCGEGI